MEFAKYCWQDLGKALYSSTVSMSCFFINLWMRYMALQVLIKLLQGDSSWVSTRISHKVKFKWRQDSYPEDISSRFQGSLKNKQKFVIEATVKIWSLGSFCVTSDNSWEMFCICSSPSYQQLREKGRRKGSLEHKMRFHPAVSIFTSLNRLKTLNLYLL